MNATARKHTLALLAAVALAVPALTACGVNFEAQTDQVYTPSEGVSDRSGQVNVLNAMIVSGTDGTGRLIAGLANNNTETDDAITGIRSADPDAPVTVTNTGGNAVVPAGGYLQLADEGSAVAIVTGDTVVPGDFVRVTFTFTNAEPATLNVPVIEQAGTYADVAIPTASPSASPSPSLGVEPTEGPSASPAPEETP